MVSTILLGLLLSTSLFSRVYVGAVDTNALATRKVIGIYADVKSQTLLSYQSILQKVYVDNLAQVLLTPKPYIFPHSIIDTENGLLKSWVHIDDKENECVDNYLHPDAYNKWTKELTDKNGTFEVSLSQGVKNPTTTKLYFTALEMPKTAVDEEEYFEKQLIHTTTLSSEEQETIEATKPVLQLKVNEPLVAYKLNYLDYNNILDNIGEAIAQALNVKKNQVILTRVLPQAQAVVYQFIIQEYGGSTSELSNLWRKVLQTKDIRISKLVPQTDFQYPSEEVESTPAPNNSQSTTTINISEDANQAIQKTNTAVVIGGVAGGILGGALLGAAAYFITKKLKSKKTVTQDTVQEDDNISENSEYRTNN